MHTCQEDRPLSSPEKLGFNKTRTRQPESGNALTFHFCPTCGTTVYSQTEGFPGYVAGTIGNFADPNFPRADHRGVGGGTPPPGLLVARHAAQARSEAG